MKIRRNENCRVTSLLKVIGTIQTVFYDGYLKTMFCAGLEPTIPPFRTINSKSAGNALAQNGYNSIPCLLS